MVETARLTQALGGGALEQVVDGDVDDDAAAAAVHAEAADLDAVAARDGLDRRRLARDADEALARVALREGVADVAGARGLRQRQGYGVLRVL